MALGWHGVVGAAVALDPVADADEAVLDAGPATALAVRLRAVDLARVARHLGGGQLRGAGVAAAAVMTSCGGFGVGQF